MKNTQKPRKKKPAYPLPLREKLRRSRAFKVFLVLAVSAAAVFTVLLAKPDLLPWNRGSLSAEDALKGDITGKITDLGVEILAENTEATPEEARKLLETQGARDDDDPEQLVAEFKAEKYPLVPPEEESFTPELLDMSALLSYLDSSSTALKNGEGLIDEEDPRYVITSEDGETLYSSEIRRGDRAGLILSKWLDKNGVANALDAAKKVYKLNSIAVGRKFSVAVRDTDGAFLRFTYDISSRDQLIVSCENGKFTAVRDRKPIDTKLVFVSGTLDGSLLSSVKKAGETATFAANYARAFTGMINFSSEARSGDKFYALVEKNFLRGEFTGYGAIIAARYVGKAKTREVFYIRDSSNTWQYFDIKGATQKRILLSSPLAHLKVTSGYTMHRMHPIFHVVRAHQGIDYGAPRGTPVMSIGDGTVEFAGYRGGYGKTVIVRHNGSIESQYAHLNGYARGIKVGSTVSQGQTIGYVGSTGTATGPHLDFRIIRNGQFINPAKVTSVTGSPLTAKGQAILQNLKKKADAVFDGKAALPSDTPYFRGDWTN